MALDDYVRSPITVQLGPNKKYSGLLLTAQEHHLVVQDERVGPIFISLEHVKQLCTGAAPHQGQLTQNTQAASWTTEANTLYDVLRSMQYRVVQADGFGVGPITGYLNDVKTDYMVVSVIPDGTLYCPFHHLQSVYPLDAEILPEFAAWAKNNPGCHPDETQFADRLRASIGQLVHFGRDSPESAKGLLRMVHVNYVEVVVSPYQVVCIPMHHIKSYSLPGCSGFAVAGEFIENVSNNPGD